MNDFEKQKIKLAINTNIGLMTASFGVFMGLLQVDSQNFDRYLLNTLYCFAFVLPLSVYYGFALRMGNVSQISDFLRKILPYCTLLTVIAAFIGILNLIKHFSSTASNIFSYTLIGTAFFIILEVIMT